MSHNLLKGKRGIIFGALNDMSIAWKVAEKAVEEGATITLSNTPIAVRMGQVDALAEKLHAEVIPADATSVEDLETVFSKSVEILGGKIDFVLHSIGMSPNVRKKRTYDDLDYSMLEKTLDISAISFHKMLQVAKKQDAIAEYGSVIALSYVAAQRTFFGYNDMADAKSLLESIARSFGYIYGREKNVRINTISQSPTLTTAGSGVKGMDHGFRRKDEPAGQCHSRRMCRLLRYDVLRPHPQSHNAEPLPRRWLLKHGYEPSCHDPVQQRSGRIYRRKRTHHLRLSRKSGESGKVKVESLLRVFSNFQLSTFNFQLITLCS